MPIFWHQVQNSLDVNNTPLSEMRCFGKPKCRKFSLFRTSRSADISISLFMGIAMTVAKRTMNEMMIRSEMNNQPQHPKDVAKHKD